MSKTKSRRPLLAALAVAGAFSCSHPAASGPPTGPAPNAFPAGCVAGAGHGARRDSIRVIEDAPLSSRDAPVPRSGAERVAFALAYQTLVSADCRENPEPGVARVWDREGDGWRFVIGEDAHFWDGAPVLAADVLAAWRQHDSSLAARATPEGLATIHVTGDDGLLAVTDPAAAVTKPAPDGGWPIGTGTRWITAAPAGADALVLPTTPGAAPRLTFAPGSDDARDALESHADAVITDDRAALAYAAARPRFAILPLAWSGEYVLVTSDRVSVDRGDLAAAVRVDGAPAADPGCPATGSPRVPRPDQRRVAYRQGDPVAEALAARLIGSGALGRGVFAVPLRGAAWDQAQADGSEWAVIDRRPAPAPCGQSWGAVTPLIAVRSSVILDRSLLPLRLGAGGAPRLGEAP